MNTSPDKNNKRNMEKNFRPIVYFVSGAAFAIVLCMIIGVSFFLLFRETNWSSGSTSSVSNGEIDGSSDLSQSKNSSTDSEDKSSEKDEDTADGSVDESKKDDFTNDDNATSETNGGFSNVDTNTSDDISENSDIDDPSADDKKDSVVWITESGSKYHSKPSCSGMKSPQEITLEEAEREGYEPCKRCH